MSSVKIKSGDTAIEFTNPTGEPLAIDGVTLDLTGATILFLLKLTEPPYTAYSLTAAADGTPTGGNVVYAVGTGFPTAVGQYKQNWEVTLADSTIATFPSGGYNLVQILDDLN